MHKVNDCRSERYSPAIGITPLQELLHLLTSREITRAHAKNIFSVLTNALHVIHPHMLKRFFFSTTIKEENHNAKDV
jgi:hypothetical protein